jgi:nucleotide-binding universal stress UspA family protein
MSYQRILVPVDFSADSLNALKRAVDEFARPGNALVLLHVVESPGDEASNPLTRGRMQAVSRADMTTDAATGAGPLEDALRQLKDLAAPHAGKFQSIDALVQAGEPTETIIDMVSSQGTDLVIMGSHGRGGLGKMLFGSTTYDVARKVKCSVLISKSA